MMARSTNAPFKGRIQKRKTNHLQIITFGLQRTAGPYKGANSELMRRRRVPLFDHLVDIGELLGQPRFAITLDHQLRIF